MITKNKYHLKILTGSNSPYHYQAFEADDFIRYDECYAFFNYKTEFRNLERDFIKFFPIRSTIIDLIEPIIPPEQEPESVKELEGDPEVFIPGLPTEEEKPEKKKFRFKLF